MKKKTIKTFSTIIIVVLLGICAFLTYKLYDLNKQIEKINTQAVEQNNSEKTPKLDDTAKTENNQIAVYEDSNRGVNISLIDYNSIDGSTNKHVIITLETKYSVEYMYGTYYTNDNGQTYFHFQQDIGQLKLNGIDGIEIEPDTNGGTNVKVTVSENSITIGKGTLKRI